MKSGGQAKVERKDEGGDSKSRLKACPKPEYMRNQKGRLPRVRLGKKLGSETGTGTGASCTHSCEELTCSLCSSWLADGRDAAGAAKYPPTTPAPPVTPVVDPLATLFCCWSSFIRCTRDSPVVSICGPGVLLVGSGWRPSLTRGKEASSVSVGIVSVGMGVCRELGREPRVTGRLIVPVDGLASCGSGCSSA